MEENTYEARVPEATPPAAPPPPAPGPALAPPAAPRGLPRKSLLVTGLLSLIPGLGHVYLGYYRLAFIHIAAFAALVGLAPSSSSQEPTPMFVFGAMFFYFYNMVDAVRRASIINQALDGLTQLTLPEEMPSPTAGSLGMGVLLIAAGFLFALNTLFGLSLAWIQHWWPLAVIGFGVYLVVKSDAFQEWRDRG